MGCPYSTFPGPAPTTADSRSFRWSAKVSCCSPQAVRSGLLTTPPRLATNWALRIPDDGSVKSKCVIAFPRLYTTCFTVNSEHLLPHIIFGAVDYTKVTGLIVLMQEFDYIVIRLPPMTLYQISKALSGIPSQSKFNGKVVERRGVLVPPLRHVPHVIRTTCPLGITFLPVGLVVVLLIVIVKRRGWACVSNSLSRESQLWSWVYT